jgi:hypothetical protein
MNSISLHRQFKCKGTAQKAGFMPTYWPAYTIVSLSNDRESSRGPVEDSVT